MAGRGRPPKINIQQEVYHETKEHKEQRESATPIYEKQEFVPPETLTEAELKVWNHLVEIIRGTQGGYVSDADTMVMEVYCKAKVEYDRACKEWSKKPQMYIEVKTGGFDRNGDAKTSVKINQWYQIKKDFSLIMTKYLDQLGISPLGRAKQGLQSTKSKKDKEMEELRKLFDRED